MIALPPDDLDAAGLAALQAELAPHVIDTGRPTPSIVAGIDVAYEDDTAYAAAVALSWPALQPLATAVVTRPDPVGYVPGLFALRELAPAHDAWRALVARLGDTPDVTLVDAHGLAHPQRCGLASHLGLVLDAPTIGVAKTRLIGQAAEPAAPRGARSLLTADGQTIGAVLRTQTGVNPVYVSVGHRVDLDTACAIVLAASPTYRLSEPLRAADHACKTACP